MTYAHYTHSRCFIFSFKHQNTAQGPLPVIQSMNKRDTRGHEAQRGELNRFIRVQSPYSKCSGLGRVDTCKAGCYF